MRRAAVSWAAAVLAAVALTAAALLSYADRTLFSSDGFAARVEAAADKDAVRTAAARRVTDAAIGAVPDLVAVRPLILLGAGTIIGTPPFRSLLRHAAYEAHRSAFGENDEQVAFRVRDAGLLLADAIRRVRPEAADRIPPGVVTTVARVRGGVDGALLALAERADDARRIRWVALALAVLLGLVAVLAPDSRRAGAFRLGAAVAVAGAVVAVLAWIAPSVAATNVGPADRDAARAVVDVWTGPLRAWGIAFMAIGAVVAVAAATTRPSLSQVRGPRRVRGLRAGLAALVVAAGVAVTAAASDDGAPPLSTGACNGHAALCDRRVDDVAFLGTHNSMSADGEPGWLFAAQDAGIPQQLDAGVRALLVDTHYGIGTPRGVATDLSGENATRAKLVAEVGEEFVATAERIGRRIGRDPQGERAVYLCHTLCEVGATGALEAFRGVHRFLVRHPSEVLVLSVQDDTTAEDTARVIRESGLAGEVYQGRAERPWPTLRELIDRDERVIVLAENHAGGAPWIHRQPAVMQETPFHFRTEAELGAADSCRPNRGGTDGSLLLVNHWVDTSPAPRVTIARRVNARGFLDRRVDRCRAERGMLPNVLAIDFYRQGDAAAEVDRLNRLP